MTRTSPVNAASTPPLPPTRLETHLTIDSDAGNAVQQLAAASGLSKQRIKQAMQKGAVWLTQGKNTRRLRRATRTLHSGDGLHLYYDETVLASSPPAPTLIADLRSYSVWYKPAGMLSQGSKWGDHCAISRWVEQHLTPQRPAFIVHRLDRAASGLILVAHGKSAAAALTKLFHDRLISKHYRVIVHGQFPAQPATHIMDSSIDGRQARSSASLLGYDATQDQSLLAVDISTGRKHQIRRHLAEQGYPVVGDRLYGRNTDKLDLQLTACSLQFNCPLTQSRQHFSLSQQLLPAGKRGNSA